MFKSLVTIQEIRLNWSFTIKWLTFYFLIWPLNLDFAQKFFEVARATKKLLQTPEVAQKFQSTIGAIRERRETVEEREKNPKE